MSRVAVVTGAAGGLGSAIVRALRSARFQVVATDVAEMDVTDPAAVQAVASGLERVDVLVNAAGVFARTPALGWDEGAALRMVQVNLLGALRCTAAFGAVMARQPAPRRGPRGRIVNVSSVSGLTGAAVGSVYAATKAGLIAATRSAARELAPHGIVVNAVAPGFCDTEMLAADRALVQAFTVPRIPLRRLGRPDEVAEAVRFLATCRTDYLTGAVLTLDGGLSVG